METTVKDVARGGGEENDNNENGDKDDVQGTVNMDSISTSVTPQFPARGAASVLLM